MRFFKRLFRIGSLEANSFLDKVEDKEKMATQAMIDLKSKLVSAKHAEVKARQELINLKKDYQSLERVALEHEAQAKALIAKIHTLEGDQAATAERLAKEVLAKKKNVLKNALQKKEILDQQEVLVSNTSTAVQDLESKIQEWENRISSIKVRARVADSSSSVQKELSGIDESSATAELDKFEESVKNKEAEAQAYADLSKAHQDTSVEVKKFLDDSIDSEFEALKAASQKA